jgi:hypothetical protein
MYLHSLKKQSSISLTSSLLEQKTINSLFSKHYVRADILGNTSTQLLDNNNTFINFTTQELKKKSLHLDTKNINIGRSVALDSFIFKNKRNNTVQLDSFLENRRISIENKLLDLTFWLNSLQKYKIKKRAGCSLLKPVKGGFFCYSGGVKGFLPRKQTLRAFFRIFFHFFKNAGSKKLSNLNFLINQKHSFYENGLFKLPILLGKINLATRTKYKNFSYIFHKKRTGMKNKSLNYLNFVFLTYLKKQKLKKVDSTTTNFVQTLNFSNKLSVKSRKKNL